MLSLTSLQESWPVSGWILRLFVYIMERLKCASKPPIAPGFRPGLLNTNMRPSLHATLIPQTEKPGTNPPRQVHDGPNQQTGVNPPATGSIFDDMDVFDEMFMPNMFVSDEYYEGQEVGQVDLFDLLRVPDWDNIATSSNL